MYASTYINRWSIIGGVIGAVIGYGIIAYEALHLHYGWTAVIAGPIFAPFVHAGVLALWQGFACAFILGIACLAVRRPLMNAIIRYAERRTYQNLYRQSEEYLALQQELDDLIR